MWRLRAAELAVHGERVALVGVRAPITYRVLAGRGLAVEDALRGLGGRPGDRVALLSSQRGFDEPVALLGALSAGAVVVPLDASSPPERLARLARESCACAVLHDDAGAALVRELAQRGAGADGEPLGRIELDQDGFVLAALGSAAQTDLAPAPELATVLFTSGSTGAPKPIPVSWSAHDAFVSWMIELLGISCSDRILRCAELSFDLAYFDHFAAWRTGATLCTLARRELSAARSLGAAIARLEPTVAYAVPALYTKLLSGLAPDEPFPASLRALCFAGEVFPPAALLELSRRAPAARLWNLYGPTETNVCTFHEAMPHELDGVSELPIGRACPYADCRIVDDDGRDVAGPGIGELCVRGPTALGGEVHTRDRVELRADGVFLFRGRLDRMRKIQGFRVDPGEVEAALRAAPGVREAAVVAAQHERLGTELVGFAALSHASTASQGKVDDVALRRWLAERLPPYMVPRVIHVVAELPRTTTGKIDYEALERA